MQDFQIDFLGTRGSIPIDGSEFKEFGGATSCILVRLGGENIVFDAGSGFLNLASMLKGQQFHLLISHGHADHILGLAMSDLMYNNLIKATIYGKSRYDLSIKEQIDQFMHPPLWPVSSDSFAADINYQELSEQFMIGAVKVSTMEGNHPGGCSVFRLDYLDKSLVYATDYEITADNQQKLIEFSQDCDLLICDGQYSQQEFAEKNGFGHSSWTKAGKTALAAQVKSLCVFHHDANRSDDLLKEAEQELRQIIPHSFFAKRGERINL